MGLEEEGTVAVKVPNSHVCERVKVPNVCERVKVPHSQECGRVKEANSSKKQGSKEAKTRRTSPVETSQVKLSKEARRPRRGGRVLKRRTP